jgi:tRNA(Ile)-lysidine synthase
VAQALRRRCGVGGGTRGRGGAGFHTAATRKVLVAVSGGPDSVALLRAMVLLAGRRDWKLQLAVGHVQHHLREDAEVDAEFVGELAKRWDLPSLRADIYPGKKSGNVEGNARRMRYAALAEMAASFGAEFVATAHHADDQLETLLMRMMRGASVRGLSGMAWRRRLHAEGPVMLIRPMLGVEHAVVLDFLESLKQAWRKDHTNESGRRLRSALRGRVVPVLRELRGDVAGQAMHVGEHLRQVATLLEEAVARAADHVVVEGGSARLDRNDARSLPGVVLTGLLRRLLLEAGAKADQLGRRKLAGLARAVADRRGGERRFEVGSKVRVVVTREAVRIGGVQKQG